MIRVVYLIDSLGMGGAEQVLVTTLAHLDRDRFEPRVCTLQDRDGNPVADSIRDLDIAVDQLSVARLRDPSALPRIIRYLKRVGADLVHTQLEFSIALGGPAARLAGIPCVSTLHTFDDPVPRTRDAARAKLMWWSLRRTHNAVVAVSEAVGRHHVDRGELDPRRVFTIYNGVNLEAFEPRDESTRSETRASLGLQPDTPIVIGVSVLREAKGFQYLIAALPDVLVRVPDATLVIVGEGDHGPSLRQQVRDLDLDRHVIFTGHRTDIADLLAAGDVFVLPTLGDVLPTAVAEAMATGLPVVASDVGGVPEMVVDRTTGYLVPPADPPSLAMACSRLLLDRNRAHRMGLAGRLVAEERFDIRTQAERLGAFYGSVLRGAARPAGTTRDST